MTSHILTAVDFSSVPSSTLLALWFKETHSHTLWPPPQPAKGPNVFRSLNWDVFPEQQQWGLRWCKTVVALFTQTQEEEETVRQELTVSDTEGTDSSAWCSREDKGMFHTNCFTFAGFAHQQSSVAVCASHSMVCVCVCVPNTRSRFVIV